MIRCFLSDRSQWTIDEDAQLWLRVPRWPGAPHPGPSYDKTGGAQPLKQYFTWSQAEIFADTVKQTFHGAGHRSWWLNDGEVYLFVERPDAYWIETVVKEVFL